MKKIFNYSNLFEEKISYDKDTEVLISKCVIPRIQRAYAQGRREESYVRNNLLDEIFLSLYEGREIDLNFVYGAVHKQGNNGKYSFEVIDGQQRLTTLYLLYWYIGNRELVRDSEEYKHLTENLSKFVYETRATATDFCQYLASYSVFGIPNESGVVEIPSAVIKDAKWYFRSFDKDSTIEGMLRMLDAIHEQYQKYLKKNGTISLYTNLNKITFYVLSLGEFGLTEELYIKMNARGLSLSPFDNFKAELIGYLRNTNFGQKIVTLGNSIKGTEVPFFMDFSSCMDTRWINIFWSKENVQYDADYFRFFYRYIANKYSVDAEGVKVEDIRNDEMLKYFADLSEKTDRYLGFTQYSILFNEHPEYFMGIKKVLDTFEKYYVSTIFPEIIPVWDEADKNHGFFAPRFTQIMRIIFYGVTEFIEAYEEFWPDVFHKWMRVLWNIVENTNIDNLSKVAALNRSIKNLIHHIADAAKEGVSFYTALSKYKTDEMDDDADTQERSRIILEEITKAGRIVEDDKWEEVFKTAEMHPYFKGMILFFYTKDMTIEDFEHRYKLVKDIFDKDGITGPFQEDGHLLLRAIISQMKDWKEMFKLNMTDKAEAQKYLKHWISSNQNIHNFFAQCLDYDSHEEILKFLRRLVEEKSQLTFYGTEPNNIGKYRRIHEALYKNKKLQSWLQEKDAFRLIEFKGNIFMARKNSWYSKIMMDTDRNKFIHQIVENYAYYYDSKEQYEVWKQIGYFNSNDVMIKKTAGSTEIHLYFTNYSELQIWAKTDDFRKSYFIEEFSIDDPFYDEDGWLRLATATYDRIDCYSYLENTYLKKIENILNL